MEQRLIDANAYAAELWKLRENYQMLDDTHTADKIMHGIFRAEQVLKEQPTVDAVPVTVCASCKYDGKCMFQSFVIENSQDDVSYDRNTFYCADGERRTDDLDRQD